MAEYLPIQQINREKKAKPIGKIWLSNTAFTHAGLTTDTERKTCKKVLSCSQARAIFCL